MPLGFGKNILSKDEKCSRGNKELGLRTHEPEPMGGFEGKICHSCFEIVKNGTREYEVTYHRGNSQLPVQADGILFVYLFDQLNRVVFKTKSKDGFYIYFDSHDIKSCKIISKNEASLKKTVITAGLLRTTENRCVQIDYAYRGKDESLVLDVGKSTDEVNTTISLMVNGNTSKPSASQQQMKEETQESTLEQEGQIDRDVKADEEEIQQAPKMASKPCSVCLKNDHSFYLKFENLCQNCFETKFGRLILKSDIASYYGGHKAFLAGGVFSKEEYGRLYLTEQYLVFAKKDNNSSKRWQIEIPLKSVDVSSYGIEEKVRRQEISGIGGSPVNGAFGGVGSIHESGKEHHLIVSYVDENGVPQASRFGVTSFRGKAIRQWAAELYNQVVKVREQERSAARAQTTANADIQNANRESKQKTETVQTKESPLLTLKMRLAKGEITKEEYEELLKVLQS
jgi:hypothetical protein